MADTKVSGLTQLTTPAPGDKYLITDVSAGTAGSKYVLHSTLFPQFDVCHYGAVGDGTTDDTAAIQAAIDAAEAVATGGVVLFPSTGTYYKITSGLTITGNYVMLIGRGKPQISLIGTGSVLTITGDECTVENLYLASDNNNAGHGIYLNGALRTRLVNNTIYNVQYHCLYTVDSWWLYSRHNEYNSELSDTGYAGVYHYSNANAIQHIADRFYGGSTNKGCVILSGSGVSFTNCDFSGKASDDNYTSTGLEVVKCLGLVVIGCYFESNTSRSLYFNGTWATGDFASGVVVSGNYFVCVYGTSAIAIDVQCVARATISGNYLVGAGNLKTGQKGININQTGHVNDIHILNDNFVSNFGAGGTANRIVDANAVAHNHWLHKIIWASAVPANGHYYELGTIIFNSAPGNGENVGWIVTAAGCACTGVWTSGQTYTLTAGTEKFYATSASRIYRLHYSDGGTVSVEPTHTTFGDAVDPGDGYLWEYITSSAYQWTVRTFGQASYRSGSATPVGSVTPHFIGEEYLDTTANVWYKAYGSANTTWAALN